MFSLQGLHFTGWAQTGERVSMPLSGVLEDRSFLYLLSLPGQGDTIAP